MRKRILIVTAALTQLLLLSGCQVWMPGGTTAKTSDGRVSMNVPTGWMFSTLAAGPGGDLVATKDGVLLQNLRVEHHELKDPLPNSKRTLTPELSPFEVAEAVVDDLRADREKLNVQILSNEPAVVGGANGFKVVATHTVADPEGLTISMVRYGAVVGDRLYLVTYSAPSRHYFDRDLAIADSTVGSLVLTAKK